MVKVEDPLFATKLSSLLEEQKSTLSATSLPISSRGTNCRKVYISWHKSTRSAWMNFGSGEIANRVAEKFNQGIYKCSGQYIRSSAGKKSESRGGNYNPLAWTITLSDLPSQATPRDVKQSVKSPNDRLRHVEVGSASYSASVAEVSVAVRTELEKRGPLEHFYLAPVSKGKRVKATALFVNEADAGSACALNNSQLPILGKGR